MKILTVSDIHGSMKYAHYIQEAMEYHQADHLLLLGDYLYHGPRNPLPEDYDPSQVLQFLNSLKSKIIAVRGNCDSEVDQMVLEFTMMQDSTLISLGHRQIFASHGHLYNPQHLPPLNPHDVFIFGHVHLPIAKKEKEIYILNPGSLSLPKENNPNSYGLLTETEFIIYDLNHCAIKQIAFD